LPTAAPLQVRAPPQSALVSQLLVEQFPMFAPLQLYWEPRLLQSEVAQQVFDGPVQVPTFSPLQVRAPPQSLSVLQPLSAAQVPVTAPVQVAPVP